MEEERRGCCDLRGLDLTRRDGRLLVVSSELASLGCNTLKDVVDERVQDGHGTVGDTSVGVDLLEDCGKDASVNVGDEKSAKRRDSLMRKESDR
jgi:hypothetical protein